jgi:hypothetical protein
MFCLEMICVLESVSPRGEKDRGGFAPSIRMCAIGDHCLQEQFRMCGEPKQGRS